MRPNAVFTVRGSAAPPKLDTSTNAVDDTASVASLSRFPCSIAPHLVLLRVLGEGGTAIVYEALHLRLNITVAVKVLRSSDSSVDSASARLLREAELCARIDSTRVPRVYDVDTFADGTPYVVMDIVRGRSLEEVIEHGPLDFDVACAITSEVLRAVGDLHAAGVVHRDIKPSNLMVEDHPRHGLRVRVLDLGIAHPLPQRDEPWEDRARLTQQGMLVGTPHYMASEQLCGDRADERTDIYAVGVMLYEMLSGSTPYDGHSANEVITAALRHEPKPLGEIRPEVPLCLQKIVMRAMHKSPEERYASTQEMLAAIRDFHANENTWRLALPHPEHMRVTRSTRRPASSRFASARAFAPLLLTALLGTAAFPSATAESEASLHELGTTAPIVLQVLGGGSDLAEPPHLSLLRPTLQAALSQGAISDPQPNAPQETPRKEAEDESQKGPRRERHGDAEDHQDDEASNPDAPPRVPDDDPLIQEGIPLNPYLEKLEALLSAEEPKLLDPFANEATSAATE